MCAPSRANPNQIDDFLRHGRPALGMATLPAPVQSESSSMPCDHCFGLDDHNDRSPTIPGLRAASPQDSVLDAELYFVGTLRALKDQKLMIDGQYLRMEFSSAPKALASRMERREDDLEHVVLTYPEVRSNSTGSIGMDFPAGTGELFQHPASNHKTLNFTRALIDFRNASIAVHSFDWIFPTVAVAPVNLDGLVCYSSCHLRREQFCHS